MANYQEPCEGSVDARRPLSRKQSKPARTFAGFLAKSPLLTRGQKLFQANTKDPNLQLSGFQKLQITLFLVLSDYCNGTFPPTHEDRSATFDAEVRYFAKMPARSVAEMQAADMRKPCWNSRSWLSYTGAFGRLWRHLEEAGVQPGQRLLELGCGTGWMAEAFAIAGYNVVGTSIAADQIEVAQKRAAAVDVKGVRSQLSFVISPMESVHRTLGETAAFDAVFVFEALHHAFSWRESFHSAWCCLKPGGWFLVANEPNRLHTLRSYRVARLTGTHEIGLSRTQMVKELTRCGFSKVRVLGPTFNDWWRPHWIVAQK